jgi:hypothetical protein
MKHKHYTIEALSVFEKGETHDHPHYRHTC